VKKLRFNHPKYDRTINFVLEGSNAPPREVDDAEIYSVDRYPFQGKDASEMAARILKIDPSVSALYFTCSNNFRSFQNARHVYQAASMGGGGGSIEGYIQE